MILPLPFRGPRNARWAGGGATTGVTAHTGLWSAAALEDFLSFFRLFVAADVINGAPGTPVPTLLKTPVRSLPCLLLCAFLPRVAHFLHTQALAPLQSCRVALWLQLCYSFIMLPVARDRGLIDLVA